MYFKTNRFSHELHLFVMVDKNISSQIVSCVINCVDESSC